eukprot:CAMPEP_0118677748 /NCGR_PEP_ID=MMETSP0800-20121206/2807_1 /TAXON_ID=210618 ORGANISM="Striatella unipunctata, Strain CCMP2910" /NCGR_SAMPLE_ID=MMETSP0800 /ASSEMBLY_ACC=CAM_ASM_000638 /LENGTH=670 /DNA_ID=CAMNT_0006573471 /DNA_START=47 /DNA_END=2059 /DNA_ORIENTATION=+
MELWFKPLDIINASDSTTSNNNNIKPIITIGQQQQDQSIEQLKQNWCSYFDFRLAQVGNTLQLEFATANPWEPCQQITIDFFPLSTNITHFAFAAQHNRQAIYINGQAYPFNNDMQFPFLLSKWKSSNKITFFSDLYTQTFHHQQQATSTTTTTTSASASSWYGILYSFSIDRGFMTQDDASNSFKRGTGAPGPLVALDTIVTINEDAEKIAGSHPPSWYSNHDGPSFDFSLQDLSHVLLRVDHVDAEIRDLHKLYNVSITNTTNEEEDETIESVFVTRLPEQGQLYQMDGTPIVTINQRLEFVASSDPTVAAALVYIPEKNTYSENASTPLASFSFGLATTTLHPNFPTIDDDMIGTVSVIVEEVNDPPVPDPQVFKMSKNNTNDQTFLIVLDGADIDGNITDAFVTKYPDHGELFLVEFSKQTGEPKFNKKIRKAPAGTRYPIPVSNHPIGSCAVVGYKFHSRADHQSDIPDGDSFDYLLVDDKGKESVEMKVGLDFELVESISTFSLAPTPFRATSIIPTASPSNQSSETRISINLLGFKKEIVLPVILPEMEMMEIYVMIGVVAVLALFLCTCICCCCCCSTKKHTKTASTKTSTPKSKHENKDKGGGSDLSSTASSYLDSFDGEADKDDTRSIATNIDSEEKIEPWLCLWDPFEERHFIWTPKKK